jgi:ribonuclease E
VLRALEDQLMKGATHNLIARTRPDVALYVLNQKRAHLRALEERFAITITISADETLTAPQAFAIDRGEQVHTLEAAKALAQQTEATAAPLEEEDDLEEPAAADDDESEEPVAEVSAEQQAEGGRRRRRRRRRGRNGGAEAGAQPHHDERPRDDQRHQDAGAEAEEEFDAETGGEMPADELAAENGDAGASNRSEQSRDGERRRRRRGRRGGRRNRMERERDGMPESADRDLHASSPDRDLQEPSRQHDPYEPEPARASAEELTAPSVLEPDLTNAVGDLDAASIEAPPSAESADVPATQTSPPPAPPEPARRRSTVREPAPTAATSEGPPPAPSEGASPAPQPVITEVGDSESTERPRRSGWWSRRFAGG